MGSTLSTALCLPAYHKQGPHRPLRKQLNMKSSDRIKEVTKTSFGQSGIYRCPEVADLTTEELFDEYYGGEHGSLIGLVKDKCEEFADQMALAWRPIERIEKTLKKSDKKKDSDDTEGSPKKKDSDDAEGSPKKKDSDDAEGSPKEKDSDAEGSPKKKDSDDAEGSPKEKDSDAEGSPKKKDSDAEGSPKKKDSDAEGSPKKKDSDAEGSPKKKDSDAEVSPKKKDSDDAEGSPKKKDSDDAEGSPKKKDSDAEGSPKKKDTPKEEVDEESKKKDKKPKVWRTTVFKPSESMTYSELWHNACAFAKGLQSLEIKPRTKVALYSDTCKEWLLSCYALWLLDLVGVTVYANLGKDALAYALSESEVEYVICQEKSLNLLKGLKLTQKKLTVICIETDGGASDQEDEQKSDEKEEDSKSDAEQEGSPVHDVKVHHWRELQAKGLELLKSKGSADLEETMAKDPHSTALIMYTSGTTGNPKGCVLTHGNIYASVKGYQSRLAQFTKDPEYDEEELSSPKPASPQEAEEDEAKESPKKKETKKKEKEGTPKEKDDSDSDSDSDEENVIEPDPVAVKAMLKIRNPAAEAVAGKGKTNKQHTEKKSSKKEKEAESPSNESDEQHGVTPARSRKSSVSKGKNKPEQVKDESDESQVRVQKPEEEAVDKTDGKSPIESKATSKQPKRSETDAKPNESQKDEVDFEPIDIKDDVPSYVAYLPLAHILEFVAENVFLMYGGVVCYGSAQTLTSRSCKPRGDLEEFRPLFFIGVPRVFDTVKKAVEAKLPRGLKRSVFDRAIKSRLNGYQKGNISPFWDKLVFDAPRKMFGGRLRACMCGGAPLNASTQQWMSAMLGVSVGQGFALTETCASGCLQDYWDLSTESSGTLLPTMEMKLVDKKNWRHTNSPPQGEVWLRGPVVCKGYYKQEDKTKEAFTEDGWFKTGDIAEIAPNGDVKIIGRSKGLAKNLNGEYIAVESLESTYVESDLVAPNSICVLVNPDKSYIVAVLSMSEDKAMPFAKKHGIRGSYEDVLKDKNFNKKVAEALSDTAESKGKQSFELLKDVRVVSDEWTPENVLTAANKLKRDKVEEEYKELIDEMWEQD